MSNVWFFIHSLHFCTLFIYLNQLIDIHFLYIFINIFIIVELYSLIYIYFCIFYFYSYSNLTLYHSYIIYCLLSMLLHSVQQSNLFI